MVAHKKSKRLIDKDDYIELGFDCASLCKNLFLQEAGAALRLGGRDPHAELGYFAMIEQTGSSTDRQFTGRLLSQTFIEGYARQEISNGGLCLLGLCRRDLPH